MLRTLGVETRHIKLYHVFLYIKLSKFHEPILSTVRNWLHLDRLHTNLKNTVFKIVLITLRLTRTHIVWSSTGTINFAIYKNI